MGGVVTSINAFFKKTNPHTDHTVMITNHSFYVNIIDADIVNETVSN